MRLDIHSACANEPLIPTTQPGRKAKYISANVRNCITYVVKKTIKNFHLGEMQGRF